MTLTGSELKAYREQCGVSQSDVAQALKTDQTLVSMWENGRRPMPPEHVQPYLRFVQKTAEERARIARRKPAAASAE